MAKTTPKVRERIYRRHLSGETYQEIADDLGVSYECIRYWCRKLRKGESSVSQYWGRPQGLLSTFAPQIAEKILELRRAHPKWGPKSIRHELGKAKELEGLRLPSRPQIGAYLHHRPEFRRKPKISSGKRQKPRKATRVHQRWQIDFKLGVPLENGRQVNLHTIRDEFGAVCVDARVTDSGEVGRKALRVTENELRETLRHGFTRWGVLPEEIQTDNEPLFTNQYSFPSTFTMWLVGLGIRHRLIRAGNPTDNAEVERSHQTIMNYSVTGNQDLDITSLQARLDEDVYVLAHEMPSDAKGCNGRPPIEAFPELLSDSPPFPPGGELAFFQMERVYAYLATFTWSRKVGKTGQIALGGQHQYYSVGRPYAGETVSIRFDPEDCQLVFFQDENAEQEIRRRPLRPTISPTGLTGLDAGAMASAPVQMPLPFPVFYG